MKYPDGVTHHDVMQRREQLIELRNSSCNDENLSLEEVSLDLYEALLNVYQDIDLSLYGSDELNIQVKQAISKKEVWIAEGIAQRRRT